MRSPSTCTMAVSGCTRLPISRTTTPSTVTRPAAISSSAALRDATPAWASTFCSRTPSGCASVIVTSLTNSQLVDSVDVGQQRGQRRKLRKGVQARPLQEHLGGGEQGALYRRVDARFLHEA